MMRSGAAELLRHDISELRGSKMAGKIGKSVYSTSAWRSLRLAALQAAGWRCARCDRYGNEAHTFSPAGERWAALSLHSPVSKFCAERAISNDTHRGGAPRGTHCSLACAEA